MRVSASIPSFLATLTYILPDYKGENIVSKIEESFDKNVDLHPSFAKSVHSIYRAIRNNPTGPCMQKCLSWLIMRQSMSMVAETLKPFSTVSKTASFVEKFTNVDDFN